MWSSTRDDGQARLDLALLYLKTGANADALRELEKLPKVPCRPRPCCIIGRRPAAR